MTLQVLYGLFYIGLHAINGCFGIVVTFSQSGLSLVITTDLAPG